ncbi:hypothetical protein MNO11_09155 [Serratia plymuthica]|nr:hypothetical protein [Serratia plymuthica]UNK29884.1 hypothetical protein MNO11_09155 [Serratia plymuthica]
MLLTRGEDDDSLVDMNYIGPLYVFNNGKVLQSFMFNFNEHNSLADVKIL